MIVWADSPKEILARAAAIEEQMMWVFSQGISPYGEEVDEKKEQHDVNVVEIAPDADGYGREEGYVEKPRPIHLTQAIMTGITLILVIAAMGSGWRQMAIETAVDNTYIRWALVACVPVQIWLALVRHERPVLSGMSANSRFNVVVLYAIGRGMRVPAHRSDQSDGWEFEILFRSTTPSPRQWQPTSHDHSVSGLQGGPLLRHRPDDEVSQSGDCYLRDARRYRQHLRQRRRYAVAS